MCAIKKSVLLFTTVIFSFATCTEFVPVYMWGSEQGNEHIPALHKISEDSFKDDILERLKQQPYIVVFAEQTLSPEDFAQKGESGETAFPNLSKLRKSSKVSYLPYVQSPVKALKHVNQDVTELSIERIRQNFEIPESNIIIIDLNDAREDEQRFQMLQRHDADISAIYNEILKKHSNVLALYTAHHTSWVASEEVINSRQARSLLATEEQTSNEYFGNGVYFYLSGNAKYAKGARNANITFTSFSVEDAKKDNLITLTGSGNASDGQFEMKFVFTNSSSNYWYLSNFTLKDGEETVINITLASKIYAPLSFSYHCGDQVFGNINSSIILPGFQVQPLFTVSALNNQTKFNDAYDCVGFTSVPIWSGLFVTAILLLIMTFGLTMIMDIKTMDRFDDAKGKTITINASE